MKSVLILVISYIGLCLAAKLFSPTDSENPGKCIYEGMELKIGENQIPNDCAAVVCFKDGSYILENCGTVAYKNCTQGDFVDISLPYPKCCKWNFECEDVNGKYTVIA